jgi:hypothetical protein
MFRLIGQLANMLCRTVTMMDHLAEAGEVQTQIIRDSSVFDAQKKRRQLEADLSAFEAEIAASGSVKRTDLKKAA